MELDSPASELNHWGFTLHFGIAGFGIGRDSRAGLGHFCSSALGLQTARDMGCGVGGGATHQRCISLEAKLFGG